MKITLRTFASIRDITGRDNDELEVPEDATAGGVIDMLQQDHEEMIPHRENLLIAVNSTYCDENTVLKEGDTIALFPPVSGG